MTIFIKDITGEKANQIIKQIDSLIDTNKVITWKKTNGGYTSTDTQLASKVFIEPNYSYKDQTLYFKFVYSNTLVPNLKIYPKCHCALLEMFLNNMKNSFDFLTISSQPMFKNTTNNQLISKDN